MTKSNKPIPHHINNFLDYLDIEKGLSNNSQKNYHRFLNKFIKWLETKGDIDLKPHQLSPQHIWDYKLYLSRSKCPKGNKYLKKSTQAYYLIALRSLVDYFSERDIASLPSSKIKLPKQTKDKIPNFLNLEEIEKLLLQPDIETKIGLRD